MTYDNIEIDNMGQETIDDNNVMKSLFNSKRIIGMREDTMKDFFRSNTDMSNIDESSKNINERERYFGFATLETEKLKSKFGFQ